MEATVYVNTTSKEALASLTGSGKPSVTPILQTHLLLNVFFFATGAAAALLDNATTFRVALKDALNPSGAVLALLSAPTATGADFYEFEWAQLDSTALRTLLGDAPCASAVLEISWTLNTVVERVHIPVSIVNAWIRTADTAPDFQPLEATITAGGYLQLKTADGTYFNVGLNSGQAPS